MSSSAQRATVDDAAAMLRRILTAVDEGKIEASSAQAVAMVRRLQGAVVALGALTSRPARD